MQRWATFDCYGTLIDWDGGVSIALHELWPHADVAGLLATYHEIERLVQRGRSLSYREVLIRTLGALAAVHGLPLAEAHRTHLPDSLPRWPAFPDVAPAFAELRRRGWKVAILSNTDPDLLDSSIATMGTGIDLRITAAEAGSYKPATGHWRAFRSATGAERAGHVHVAASPFHDLVTCGELGIPAVWINRTGETSDAPRAAELSGLRDLPDVLDRLAPASG